MNARTITAAIALLALLTGCIGDNPDKTAKDAMNKSDPRICDKISDYRMRYNCSMQIAVSRDNTTMCAGIESEEWKNDCLSAIAAQRKDMTVCDSISGSVEKDSCYRSVAAG